MGRHLQVVLRRTQHDEPEVTERAVVHYSHGTDESLLTYPSKDAGLHDFARATDPLEYALISAFPLCDNFYRLTRGMPLTL